jgi:hypothetical protein
MVHEYLLLFSIIYLTNFLTNFFPGQEEENRRWAKNYILGWKEGAGWGDKNI